MDEASRPNPLSPARLLEESRARTGLHEFGKGWQEGFGRLLRELAALELPPAQVASSAARIRALLDARLMTQAGWTRNPACLSEAIKRPLIIAGIVRSGTTALHKLLSMDAQFQGPEHWLTLAPMKRPPRAEWQSVPAYREVAGALKTLMKDIPELRAEHLSAVDEVDESLVILAQNFSSNYFGSMWDVPAYDAWQRAQDQRPDYCRLADVLRLIGAGDSRTWLLKNPGDLAAVPALLEAFPDARIVQTHRDPVQAIPSVANLILAGRRAMMGPDASAEAVGLREARVWAEAVRAAHAARQSAPDQFVDVDFGTFIADPMKTVRRIYEHFGIVMTVRAEAAMRAWLAANPRQSGTMQRFAPEAFGLTAAGLKADFADYRARHVYQ